MLCVGGVCNRNGTTFELCLAGMTPWGGWAKGGRKLSFFLFQALCDSPVGRHNRPTAVRVPVNCCEHVCTLLASHGRGLLTLWLLLPSADYVGVWHTVLIVASSAHVCIRDEAALRLVVHVQENMHQNHLYQICTYVHVEGKGWTSPIKRGEIFLLELTLT